MRNQPQEVNAEFVREHFDYDAQSGMLRWRKRIPYQRCSVGDEAGYLDTRGYRRVKLFGRRFLTHVLIWLHQHGQWPEGQIDHRNRNRSDNRLDNLRDVSASTNAANRTPNNKAGYLGVYYYKIQDSWSARITMRGEEVYLGWWRTKEEAIAARQAADKLSQFMGQA